MPRPVHFEIQADQPERAIRFYEAVLGWTFSAWGPPGRYWLITTGPDEERGINGGLLPRQGLAVIDGQAVNAFVCTIDVAALDATIASVQASGGSVALPRMAIPGVGWLAYFKDTEGNVFGAMQSDAEAR
jgi:uncharacterized protein